MTERLLVIAAAVEAVLLLCGILVLAAYVAVSAARTRRHAADLQRARGALQQVALAEAPATVGVEALHDLPFDLALGVLLDVAGPLDGQALTRLNGVAVDAGLTRHLDRWSTSRRWSRRLRALRLVARLRMPATSVGHLLDDGHPAVRAAAADAVRQHPTYDAITRLLTMLDDPEPLCRFAAKAALMGCGRSAAPALSAYLSAADCTQPAAVLDIALDVADGSFLAPALRWSHDADPLTRRAAAVLMSRTAGEAATGRLRELLDDPDRGVRAASARGLGNLAHWPAAAALGEALRDPEWEVRSAAAVALRRMGAPGRVYLRTALRSRDAFAADIARQSLALPEGVLSVAGR